eukprot:gene22007-28490_t
MSWINEPKYHYAIILTSLIGLISILKVIFVPLNGIYRHFIRSGLNIRKFGKWAVVTGATDGIGKAMAFEFARKGLNIVVISRSQEKLDLTVSEIKTKFGDKIEVKSLAIDFGKFDESARSNVHKLLAELDVGVLVNNVGISYPFTKYFDELDDASVEALIKLNIDSTTWMTRIVLPGMKSRRRGAIVNIGSAAGVSTAPLLSQYGAAKSYIAMFSKSLNYELKSFGIHVQCQVPIYVTTKLAKLRKTSLFVASPSAYARAAINSIGYEAITSPYWSHDLQLWALDVLPEWIAAAITFSMHNAIRKAGLKKEAKALEEAKSKSASSLRNSVDDKIEIIASSSTSDSQALTIIELCICGAFASAFGDFVMHPVDTVKVFQQTAQSSISIFAAASTIFKKSGILGFYPGVIPYCLSDGVSGAIKFVVFEVTKGFSERKLPSTFLPISRFVCAAVAMIACSVALVPGEVIKTRLQSGGYSSISSLVSSTLQLEGLQGFFTGYWATLVRDVPYTMLELGLYENIKALLRKFRGREDLHSGDELLAAAITGGITSFVTTPLDLVKTKLMVQSSASNIAYLGVWDALH